ncbi:MAG: glycerol-3-phosphate acyltransferase [Bacillus sp. (in: Bacteria)]|nr:glycerol-3-phosphate acyltransferase [Bacillus sp. (in: firmicutes)]
MIWLYFVISYLIGSLMFGFLVTKTLYHQDIRFQGSGNVGARNVGRLHGKRAFVLIFLGDAFKGALVLLIARFLQFPDYVQLIGLGMAILGHIKPITLNFKGGKGISTFIGGMIVFEPLLIVVVILGFLILYPFTKSFTFSGLGAFLLIPLFLLIKDYQWLSSIIVSSILVFIFLAHSENIRERLQK